ncbi:hypothetical protein NDI45_14090 [Leptolyngbya sp. GB1-A1]
MIEESVQVADCPKTPTQDTRPETPEMALFVPAELSNSLIVLLTRSAIAVSPRGRTVFF